MKRAGVFRGVAAVSFALALAAAAPAVAAPVAAPPPPLPPASAPPPVAPRTGTPAPPIPVSPPVPAAPAPSPVPPTAVAPPAPVVEPAAPDGQPTPAVVDEAPAQPREVPTADASGRESDHAAVVGGWGVEVRPVAASLPVFARRSTTGCPLPPAGQMADCPDVNVSMLGVRHWVGPNLAWNGGLALALGGGRDGGRLLDSYFGVGPSVGASILLGNWRHLAVAASPNLTVVVFKSAGSADATYVADLRADLEGELHFGFIGVPALALSLRSGLLLRLEHASDTTLWSASVAGATTLRSLVSDLTVRYYF